MVKAAAAVEAAEAAEAVKGEAAGAAEAVKEAAAHLLLELRQLIDDADDRRGVRL